MNNSIKKRFEENLFSFIKQNTHEDDKFVLAVSGGADSMVLLDMFILLKEKMKTVFCVANIDHKLRKESAYEQAFLGEFCRLRGIRFYSESIDIKALKSQLGAKASVEQLAREKRHEALERIKTDFDASWIVTAHHCDDLLETFFLRLFRGTGIKGMNTLNEVEKPFLRPLLVYWKQDILEYAKASCLTWFEDQTNKDINYLRNRIRLELIPFIEREFKDNPKKVLIRDMENFKKADRLINELLEVELSKAEYNEESVSLDQDTILNRSDDYAGEFLLRLYYRWIGSPVGLSESKLNDICSRIRKPGDFEITITDEIRFLRNGRIIGFERRKDLQDSKKERCIVLGDWFRKTIEEKSVITINMVHLNSEASLSFSLIKENKIQEQKPFIDENIALLDYDRIVFPMKLRLWTYGDKMRPLGMNQNKRISRLLTDAGIKKYQKRTQLILEDGKHDIIWCVGVRISQDYKITRYTANVLKVRITH